MESTGIGGYRANMSQIIGPQRLWLLLPGRDVDWYVNQITLAAVLKTDCPGLRTEAGIAEVVGGDYNNLGK